MNRTALVWDPRLAEYDLGDGHPLNPVRLTLSVDLMRTLGLLREDNVLAPREATEDELRLVHSAGYVEAVRHAGDWASDFRPRVGLGTEDNPVYPGMHEIAALTCGGSILAVDQVLSGRWRRTFSIAGGMHHAHKARAAGFSIYNDAAVAIAAARRTDPGLKVLYLDVDAHHGDGVQEAFAGSKDVLTVSIHESGVYAFPGTGFPGEVGYESGVGFSANVALPSLATDACLLRAFEQVAVPLARAFRPGLIVAQVGVDAHHADPQTELGMTLRGYRELVRAIIGLADELTDGCLVMLGGGGYHAVEVVPLAWSWVLAELGGVALDDRVPEKWRQRTHELLGVDPPTSMAEGDSFALPADVERRVTAETDDAIRQTREAVFPHHGLTP